jgi:hypothetical protein
MMLRPLDQLLMPGPLLGRENRVDLGAHPHLDGIELRPDPRPQGIGFGTMPREDRAHRIALGVAELQLALEILDHRVRSTTPGPSPRPAASVPLGRFVTTPPGQSACQEHSRQQADGRDLRSIHHEARFSLLLDE